jgi:hypothetical protein
VEDLDTEVAEEQAMTVVSPWRDGWLEGRAMSLRRLQWWVAHEWDGTREHLDARLATQMAAVQHDRDRPLAAKIQHEVRE